MITNNGHRWYQSDLKNYTDDFLRDIIDDLLEKQKDSHLLKIQQWMVMLDTTENDDLDAGMVRDEMKTLLNRYDVKVGEGEQ